MYTRLANSREMCLVQFNDTSWVDGKCLMTSIFFCVHYGGISWWKIQALRSGKSKVKAAKGSKSWIFSNGSISVSIFQLLFLLQCRSLILFAIFYVFLFLFWNRFILCPFSTIFEPSLNQNFIVENSNTLRSGKSKVKAAKGSKSSIFSIAPQFLGQFFKVFALLSFGWI